MSDTGGRRRRGGGRAGNSARRTSAGVIEQMPWRQPVNIDRPTEPLGPRLQRMPYYVEIFSGRQVSEAECARFFARHPVTGEN